MYENLYLPGATAGVEPILKNMLEPEGVEQQPDFEYLLELEWSHV